MDANSPIRPGPTTGLLLFCMVAVAFSGCSRRPSTTSQLNELERSLQDTAAAPANVAPGSAELLSARAYLNGAIAAVRTNEAAEGVILLQSAQQTTALNSQQRMAVQRTIQAVTADLVQRASRGDQRAQAELKRIERFLSSR